MPVQKSCLVCGKEFTVPPTRAETAKTCSQACRGVLIAKAYEDKRVQTECLQCGEKISVPASRHERGNGLYCGNDCRNLSMVGKGFRELVADGAESPTSGGYIYERERDHPFASRGKVMQHRLVMERLLVMSNPSHHFLIEVNGSKYLKPGIHVHHKNEIKTDNRHENLVICTPAAHLDIHAGRTPMAGEIWPESGDEIAASPRSYYRECQHCGKTFKARKADVDRGKGKYCSRECHRDHQAAESGLPPRFKKPCEVCGTEFEAKRSKAVNGQARFCSNPCRIKFLATTHTKEI